MDSNTFAEYKHFTEDVEQYDLKAEMELIQGLMGRNVIAIASIAASIEPEDFFDLSFRRVFEMLKAEIESGGVMKPESFCVDFTVKYREVLEQMPWRISLLGSYRDLMYQNIGDNRAKAIVKKLKQKRELRNLLTSLYEAVDMCRHNQNDNSIVFDYLQKVTINRVAESDSTEMTKEEFAQGMVSDFYESNDPEQRSKSIISLHWKKLQRTIGGLSADDLVIVSAASGKGKSAFSLNIAHAVGIVQKLPALYINSEIGWKQLKERVSSLMMYVDSKKIRGGEYYDSMSACRVDENVNSALLKAADTFANGDLIFKTIPDLQISNIEAAIRLDAAKRNTRLVVVDYLGRMDVMKTAGSKDLQEWQLLRFAAMRLKTLAQKYHTCVLMVAQLTDDGHLQGSHAMKNECDLWLNISRMNGESEEWNFPYNTYVEVKKARGVEDATALYFRYDGCMMRFNDSAQGIKAMIDENKKYGTYANEIMDDAEYRRLSDIAEHEQKGRTNGQKNSKFNPFGD